MDLSEGKHVITAHMLAAEHVNITYKIIPFSNEMNGTHMHTSRTYLLVLQRN